MPSSETFEEHRSQLFSLAYRMLGSVTEAEDMVQEAYLRWQRASAGEIRSSRAYLSTLVTRLCIDHLRAARVQREHYFGTWLPEPLLAAGEPEPEGPAESLSMAFLVLLESLNPVERAVFLLREVFEYDYPEVARIVGKSEANCRQIARRAREYVAARRPRFEPVPERRDQLLQQFSRACSTGDLPGLVALLDRDITLWSDGGGRVTAAVNPISGADKVARFLLGVLKKFGWGLEYHPVAVNGQPGLLGIRGEDPYSVLTVDVVEGRIRNIWIVRNPDKLRTTLPVVRALGGKRAEGDHAGESGGVHG